MRRIVSKVLMSIREWTFLRNAAIFSVAIIVMVSSNAEAKPSKAEFKDALSREIPRHFRLNDFSTEASQNLGNEVEPVWAVRFNATIQALADLYVHDSSDNGAYFVLLTTKKDIRIKVFGKIKSELYQGSWRYYVSLDGNPLGNRGIPLNQYSGRVIIRGSKQEKEYYADLQKEQRLQEDAEKKRLELERQKEIANQIRSKAEEFFEKGLEAQKKKEIDEAIAYFSKAIEIDGSYDSAYGRRGHCYFEKGDYNKALSDLIRCDKLTNDTSIKPWANFKIGEIYYRKEEYKQADKYYRNFISMKPDKYHYSYNMIAWFYATCKDKSYRDAKIAIKCATEASIMTDWNNAGYIDTLATAYAVAGNFEDAVRMQKKAVSLNPPDKQEYEKRLQKYLDKQAP
ncbi:tetratricopeptide repeat protein [Geotalea sp. SG265]|uniref:tetratricopeptide repeat protein n=1 Tax=Geotalea sp. SG265 TaxID=2922867 RepID=UPI001FAEEA50|nr:tetratricopeptide repeat protein [Geotalea sp. SG265]